MGRGGGAKGSTALKKPNLLRLNKRVLLATTVTVLMNSYYQQNETCQFRINPVFTRRIESEYFQN